MKRCFSLFVFLLNTGLLSAQDLLADNLKQSFVNYQSNTPQEKLFVHIDKSFYLAGETIWFKIYAVDASFHKPLGTSSISYIEILNKDLKPVVQTKIFMVNGCGNGSLTIPGFLLSGNYCFRAYTNWMKNFPADFYFEQTLHIVNTLKLTPLTPSPKTISAIQFFPEGGNEVLGIPVKMAFKAVNGEGRGLDCTGIIVNQNNDTITKFQSLHNGMGNFQFRPEKNATYFAVVRLNDSLIRQRLPDAADRGFVMNVSEEGAILKIMVRATPELNNSHIYLFTQTRQVIKNIQANTIREGEAVFLVNKNDLGDGISGITLFNELRQPVCERLVFKRPVEHLFIQAKTDQPEYHSRRPVQIDLTTSNKDNLSLAGNCSVAVFMIDSLQHLPDQNILSYLLLGSDLKGRIESPEYYITNSDRAADEALDNLLLTQGWRRFKWNDVFTYRKSYFDFLPEIEGPVITGKIINRLTGSPAGRSDAFLSIPGADYAFASATSDTQGLIHFGFKDTYKNNVLVIQPALLKDSVYRIDVMNSYSDKFSSNPFHSMKLSKDQENALLARSISNQVENTYAMDRKHQYAITNIDSTSFYGKPDRSYNLDDYTRFQTMEEVLREYVEDVRIRKEGDHFIFKVRNRLFGTYLEDNPLILLDGIPIGDATKIIALDPLKIKKIEVVTHNYYLGSSVFAGIVNVKSYSGDLGATQIDSNSVVVEFDGLQKQREFYSPVYASTEEQESHLPDFRNVLFWAPQISTGPDGRARLSFYTSDLKGHFAVVIQGITAEGLAGKGVAGFDVTDSK